MYGVCHHVGAAADGNTERAIEMSRARHTRCEQRGRRSTGAVERVAAGERKPAAKRFDQQHVGIRDEMEGGLQVGVYRLRQIVEPFLEICAE